MAKTPHADFDDDEIGEPSATFNLGGRRWTCRPTEDVPFGVVQKFYEAAQAGEGEGDDDGAGLMQVGPFFRATISRDEVKEFMEMLADPDGPLTLGKVQPVMEFIAGNVLGRPTEPDETSAPGPAKTGPSSVGASSRRAIARK